MLHAPKLRPGDHVAVISPSFAAPAVAPAVHEQAVRRLREITGLIPVEYPTTRALGSSPQDRARDLNAAFADPGIRAVLSTIGGNDQLFVTPHVDLDLVRADPKPFLGYSDNTNLLNALWRAGVAAFYGGSAQVHIGPGPSVDEVHLRSLRAALFESGLQELTEPGESEDHGVLWQDTRALSENGERMPTEAWTWAGPARRAEGRTWGGCIEVIDNLAFAERLPAAAELEGGILLLETSEETPSAGLVARWLRGLGERGILTAVAGVLVARPPVTSFESPKSPQEAKALRRAQRDVVFEEIARYNPEAVVCVGVPFGHTRPQVIVPYGGTMVLDGGVQRVFADYS